MTEPNEIGRVVASLLGPADPEVSCEACFEELDRYVDLELSGADADAAIPGCGRTSRGARPAARSTRACSHSPARTDWPAGYARAMTTLELDDDELRLLLAAVRSYLDDFGHDEADVLRRVKQLLAKLQAKAS